MRKGAGSRGARKTAAARPVRGVKAARSRRTRVARGSKAGADGETRITGAITLRPVTRADVATILELIRGIAEYERLAHEVKVTEALLQEHGFGPRRIFEAILAERDGQALGFALYFFTFSTFTGLPTLYLEDLFVVPPERRGGIGSRLLIRLAQIAVERNCGRMEWSVLDWNTPARDLYFKLGAKSMDAWTVFRMTPDAFGRLARDGMRP
jgi:GNAT superfamily N-acetyltransferase